MLKIALRSLALVLAVVCSMGTVHARLLNSWVLDPMGSWPIESPHLVVQYYGDLDELVLTTVVFDIPLDQPGNTFQGSASLRPGDAGFASAVAEMTNGRNQYIGFFLNPERANETGGSSGWSSPESCVLFGSGFGAACSAWSEPVDYEGMEISEIRLDYVAHPWTPVEGVSHYAMAVTFSVFAVPEPTIAHMSVAGFIVTLIAAARRRT